MKLSEELEARGFIYQFSADQLSTIVDGAPRTVYLGIDPTASSIHVGNLVPYMLLNRLLLAGHKVILLMGGGTALIGDPGGKSAERPFVAPEIIAEQAAAMEKGIRKFISGEMEVVNNHEWLSEVSMMTYLRDVGKHFTVNSMIKKDIVANRLTDDNSISYTEFSYSLLQAYDYAHLHKEYGCDVQIGGSDQWSNILAGVDYIRKTVGDEVFALTIPLVVDKATGKKFGKSEGNAIWLDAERTSPFAFYQFWMQTSDESVIDYLKLFTFMTLEDIAALDKEWQQNPGERVAQKKLAMEVASFVHGKETTLLVEQVTDILFGGTSVASLSTDGVALLKENAPFFEVQSGSQLLEVLVTAELATSKREARTFIESGAVQLDGEKIQSIEMILEKTDAPVRVLRRGKKNLAVVSVV